MTDNTPTPCKTPEEWADHIAQLVTPDGRQAEIIHAIKTSVRESHAALVEALDTIAKGMTNNFPGAPDVMEVTPAEFRSAMWSWSQEVARAAIKEDD